MWSDTEKFPNPRFNAERWAKIKGWDGVRKVVDGKPSLKHGLDASIEPPFHIGIACAGCHVAYKPSNPPEDVTRPPLGESRCSDGKSVHRLLRTFWFSDAVEQSLEHQAFTLVRPGAVDTSRDS